ncbi:MAG: UDP-N-acetylmuramate--L-alanine ligase [Candidatus Glassbacteria bacterium]|nr:UDP-N-acetylmuramate--L-alanine ligase [Candidatus Glassbacteria bacterium]
MYRSVKRIHMVGIGGSGMCGIAEILLDEGYAVSGSDLNANATTDRLKQLGAEVSVGHAAENINGADVVVISSAVSDDNVEVAGARSAQVPVIRRAEMLAELMRTKYGVAISGTHGKTTTTSMVGIVLEEAGLDPTVIVGGRLKALGGHARRGASELFVAEADEFDRSFLRLTPSIAVVTNIDTDHLDCYGSLEGIMDAFTEFVNRVPFYGTVIACMDDPNLVSVFPRIERRLLTYGESAQADIQLRDLSFGDGGTVSAVYRDGELLGELTLSVPGTHNALNALAAVAVGLELGVEFAGTAEALGRFKGVHRRGEIKGEAGGRLVVDDFAHHPTEIRAILDALRHGWSRPVTVVFQPHLYSRTRDLAAEFGGSFMQSDTLVVTEVYGSRETPLPGVTGELVAEAAREHGHRNVHYFADKSDLARHLAGMTSPGDLVVTLGAGDIYKVGEQLLELLAREGEQ